MENYSIIFQWDEHLLKHKVGTLFLGNIVISSSDMPLCHLSNNGWRPYCIYMEINSNRFFISKERASSKACDLFYFMKIYLQDKIWQFCFLTNVDWRPYLIYGKLCYQLSFYYISMGRASAGTYIIWNLISWKCQNYKPRYATFSMRQIGIGNHVGYMENEVIKWHFTIFQRASTKTYI